MRLAALLGERLSGLREEARDGIGVVRIHADLEQDHAGRARRRHDRWLAAAAEVSAVGGCGCSMSRLISSCAFLFQVGIQSFVSGCSACAAASRPSSALR